MLNLLPKTRQNSYAVNTRGGHRCRKHVRLRQPAWAVAGYATYILHLETQKLSAIDKRFSTCRECMEQLPPGSFSTAGAAIFSPFHLFTLSPFHPFTLLIFSPLISSSPNSRSSSWVRVSKSGGAVSVRWGGAEAAGVSSNTSCWCPCSVVWMCFSRT